MTTIELKPRDSIMEAISSSPEGPLTLILSKGVWREKVLVTKPDVMLVSEVGAVIETDDRHGTVRDGHEFNTGESATFTVAAPGFSAIGVTFSNSFDWPGAQAWKKEHRGEKLDTQAVAMRLAFGSDKASFRACTFLGWQDTLYIDSGSSYFEDCTIKGSVDFIFGAGSALFSGCEIISRAEGIVMAPSTFTSEEVGFIFHDSEFLSEGDVEDAKVYLSRPWHPAGSENRNPMALLIDCKLGSHITRKPWTFMSSRRPDGTEKVWQGEEARFNIFSHDEMTIDSSEAERLMRIMGKRRYN